MSTSQAAFAADLAYWDRVERAGPRQPLHLTAEQRGTFGVALRDVRIERRLSQSKLAERAGYSHSYVSRLESGDRTATRDAATQLSAALHLSDADTARLLAAAGFTSGSDREAVLDAEPCLVAALNLLGEGGLPADLRDQFRDQLFSLSAIYALAGRAAE